MVQFLLFLINHVSSLNKLPILFFLIGLGVNLHPPNAINMALVFGVVLIWKNGFSKVHYKTASQCVILFLIGALPFVIHFGTPFFLVPQKMGPKEGVGEGSVAGLNMPVSAARV